MFSDQVKITVKAGNGGDGAVSFRRERYVPKGGPDGGDGGDGGDVCLTADRHTKTLIQLYRKPHCKAQDGEKGRGQKKNGKRGQNLILKVPIGTIVEVTESHDMVADLINHGDVICVARGGSGGKGNYRFRGSTRQAPSFAQKGQKGEEKRLSLNLKLIADAGLVGFPNAGKSTLLSRVSAAKPKIADYPFTTMEPYLGVVKIDDEHSFVLADIPGIIEGAHQGVGLGTRFLKHIERTQVLVHIMDGTRILEKKLFEDYNIIEDELKKYDPDFEKKEKILVVNKCDIPGVQKNIKMIRKEFREKSPNLFFISAIEGTGLQELIYKIYELVRLSDQKRWANEEKVEQNKVVRYQYEPDFTIYKAGEMFVVEGEKICEIAERFDLENSQALDYFQKTLKRYGVEKALKKKGISNGDKVKIGEKVFYFYE